MTAVSVPLRFRVGARTLASVPRRLVRGALSLDDVLAGGAPVLPPLGDADGYLVTSLPEALAQTVARNGLIGGVRQRYVRYHTDLTIGADAWLAGLSSGARATIKRKRKRLVEASGGALDIRRYRMPDEIAAFHPLARAVSETTYQERLLGAGLPDGMTELIALGSADRLRAWLMFVEERPVAYLCCSAQGTALRYDHVGHDPGFAHLSPGSVLMVEALRDLFADRFAAFDFTEGEGQHKRQFATGGTACVDLLLLRPTLVNRAVLGALTGFDRLVDAAKRAADGPRFKAITRRVRRA